MSNEAILFDAITAMGQFNDTCHADLSARIKITKHNLELSIYDQGKNEFLIRQRVQYYRKPETTVKTTMKIQEFTDLMEKLTA
ncbi:hypothetical protein [Acinetobacter variabilis]|uniref:Uncharacterized protein n=1 Tax=Acinetobacter variabilis TaxID=70346 RepID=N8WU33_9GAMM|nr:hypothetical protein [Acinetobacter variabilis]ENV00404.1 hypothetical protein F969_00636 [Acinetobacter variabilis]